jgi:hypothetical protein
MPLLLTVAVSVPAMLHAITPLAAAVRLQQLRMPLSTAYYTSTARYEHS